MLAEHLDATHDGASRRGAAIDRQVSWIHERLLAGRRTTLLDLGCGPGLYTSRFARLGHRCVGLDMGPAAIAHAREQAARDQLDCTYVLGDLRSLPFGDGFGLVFFSYGEPSVFSRSQLRRILVRAASCLSPAGWLLLEPHTPAGVRVMGEQAPTTQRLDSGLFLERPHVLCSESSYDPVQQIGTRRYLVWEGPEHEIAAHYIWYQSYEAGELKALLVESGFDGATVAFHANQVDDNQPPHLHFVSARRAE